MKSILFKADEVKKILNGEKSVTRRVVKPQPEKGAYSPHEGVGGAIFFPNWRTWMHQTIQASFPSRHHPVCA